MDVPAHTRRAQFRFIGALAALLALWLAMLLFGTGALDRAIYLALYSGNRPAIEAAARLFTALGEPTVLIVASVLCALWLWYVGRRRLPIVLIAVTMIGRALSEIQKDWVARPRPTLDPHLVHVKTASFPSGHAMSSMIFYLTVALTLSRGTRWRRASVGAALLLSLLIGTSRVMLGVHWPSDVVGGWSFGLFWVLLTLRASAHYLARDTTPADVLPVRR